MKVKTTKKCAAKKAAPRAAKPAVKKVAEKSAEKKAVEFTVHAEAGKSVFLAGEFNGWDPTARKMAYKARRGLYTASVQLAAGTYQYKFVIDGTWCADPENVNSIPNDQGTFNSVITVR